METRHYWEENGQHVKYDTYNEDGYGREPLGLAVPSEDEAEYPPGVYLKKGKVSRQDPMSHRIIEKRRRDRMNNCLADLSRLIPPEYLKKGRGRVEKTEIIEMAIRHLKFLQERVNGLYHGMDKPYYAPERQADFQTGYQEAVAEAVRYLVEVHGYAPADGLCGQLAQHLQRHSEHFTKGDIPSKRSLGSSSETTSSSGSSRGASAKTGVITVAPPSYADSYEEDPRYAMDCDRAAVSSTDLSAATESEAPSEPLDARRKREPALRAIRKPDHEDYLHSYKFKNCIERRFSRSQDEHTAEALRAAHGKLYAHKRRRGGKAPASTTTSGSTSASGSAEDGRDASPQDTSSDSQHHHHYEKPPPTQYVPVFALNALGKYYVPLSVEYACLVRPAALGGVDALDARAAAAAAPLHPVTIHVNFQPCLNYHVKREPAERDWRPV